MEHLQSSVSSKERALRRLLELLKENRLFGDRDPVELINVDLIASGEVDSMGLLKLMALIEDAFDVQLTETDFIGELSTIEECAEYIASVKGR